MNLGQKKLKIEMVEVIFDILKILEVEIMEKIRFLELKWKVKSVQVMDIVILLL